jgi:hypothetical protein
MLISKDDLKIRIQTNNFPSLFMPLKSVIKRLQSSFEHSDEPLEISLVDTIPLNELFNAIDDHFGIQQELIRIKKILDDRSI